MPRQGQKAQPPPQKKKPQQSSSQPKKNKAPAQPAPSGKGQSVPVASPPSSSGPLPEAEVKEKPSGSAVSHPLEFDWTYWFDRGQGPRRARDVERSYESNLKEVGTFSTIEDFWRFIMKF